MREIKCPHCGEAFTVDEAGYADILKQVRDAEFEQQLHERLELAERDKLSALELARTAAEGKLREAAAEKDAAIQDLRAKLEAGETAQRLAVAEALGDVERQRDALQTQLEQSKRDAAAAVDLAVAKLEAAQQRAAAEKDTEIQALRAKLESVEVAQRLAITEAVSVVERERDELKNGLDRAELSQIGRAHV